jgi:VIT1/CCC1 family predicted Fe2+/Mn2+ transporter
MDKTSIKEVKYQGIVSDVIIGMSEGMVMPFILVVGLSRVFTNNITIAVIGLIAAIIAAIAMALGRLYMHKDDHHHHETPEVFEEMGLSDDTKSTVAHEMHSDKEKWAEVVHDEREENEKAKKSAIYIGLFYVLGAMIPIIAYFFMQVDTALQVAAIVTACILLVFSVLKAKATGLAVLPAVIRTMVVSCLAAFAAYYVAGIFI